MSSQRVAVSVSARVEREFELTRLQREVWTSQRLHPDAPLANMATLHRISGRVDPARFIAAFDSVVERADALRTVVADADGRPVARVLARPPATTDVIDLAASDVEGWARARVATPIDATACSYDSVLLRHRDDDWTWWLDLHHVITDGLSQALVFRYTGRAYEQLADGTALDDLPSYVSAAIDAEAWIDSPDQRRGRTTSIRPLGVRGPATTSSPPFRVDVGHTSLDAALAGRYRALNAELGRAALFASALAMTMYRLDGRSEYTIGMPVHHRAGAAQELVGPLMALHPVSVTVESTDTGVTLFQRTLGAIFAMLRAVRRGESDSDAFELVVNVFDAEYPEFAGMAVAARWVRAAHVDPAHVVRLHAVDYGAGLDVELDVNDALTTADRPTRLADYVSTVFDAMLRDPDAPLHAIGLATEADVAELAQLVPNAPPEAPTSAVHDVVREALVAHPTWEVAEDRSGAVSAAEFEIRVVQTLAWLRARGVGAHDRVGLRMERSVDVLVAVQAVMRAGAAFVMLDPNDPVARHVAIESDAELVLIVDDLDDVDDAEVHGDGDVEPAAVDLDDIAYVLYTSGSTGEPKGVPISHRGLADYLAFAASTYCTQDAPPTIALHSKLIFDLTITSMFLSFVTGGQVIVYDGDPVVALGRIATDDRISLLKATPAQLEVLARMVDTPRPISAIVVGGEAFRRPVAESIAAACRPGVRIFNEYGPTEAVVGCMIHEWDPAADVGVDVPIGHASPGCELAILDRAGHPAPAGVWGELYVRRVGMATGYLGRPELTKARFVHLGSVPGQLGGAERGTWYRTGDRVRMERPGVAVYGGRLDDQMNVNGVRLEPAEIEAALAEHPRVASSIVRLWTPADRASTRRCARCGLGPDVPGVELDDADVCSVCHSFDRVVSQTASWFKTSDDLDAELVRARARSTGAYDCLHLLSGGKDSSYALYQLVERGWRVHALTLDNGFISDGAKENIRRSIDTLGITHEFATADAMNEIFRDSLDRHANVCQGCYKTIYTKAVARADELGIPVIVTGLSRGQFFETRLIPAQFAEGRFDPDAIDATVLEARKVYHRVSDAVTELLPEQQVFDDDAIFDRVEFVDFYRYVDVELAELYRYLEENAPWVRPADTGRSTNCLINVAGIQVHQAERGFHNYAEPYAWDVRLGHKTREEALAELDDRLEHGVDDDDVARMLGAVDYHPKRVEVLTAWYQTDDGREIDPDELRRHVRSRVAEHAIPSAFVHLAEMPMAASAKIDVSALAAPTRLHRRRGEVVAPVNDIERQLCSIWSDVLHLEQVSTDDDFFDLGGDSLAALEVVAAIDDQLAVSLDDAAVFHARTIAELAEAVGAAEAGHVAGDIPALAEGAAAPLSAGEEAMLFEYRRDPLDPRYHVTRWYRLPADVDVAKLERAFVDVVGHHGPLRTSYASGRPILAVGDALAFVRFDAMSESAFWEFASQERSTPFDLDAGPLVRVHVCPTDDDVMLLVGLHHITIDPSTFDVFWAQVSDVYAGRPLPQLSATYAEHGAWQRDAVTPSHREFWTTAIGAAGDGREPGRIALAAPEPAGVDGYVDGYIERIIDITATELRRAPGTTSFATALAAAAVTLAQWSADPRVAIGIAASTKDHPTAAPLVGYFLNTLPLTIDVDDTASFDSLAASVSDLLAGAITHRTVPFAAVVHGARQLGQRTPDVSYMLAYERLAPAELNGVEVDNGIIAPSRSVADVTFFVQERGERVSIGIEYAGRVLDAGDVERMLGSFDQVLRAAIDHPTQGVRGLTAASVDLHGPTLDVAAPTVLHKLLDHVVATPDAVAVVDAHGSRLTYVELASAVLRTADAIDKAIEEATTDHPTAAPLVGISIARSTEMVVALLAAQLSGAAYVPLDPSSPRARLDEVIGAIDMPLVLTDEANSARFENSLPVTADPPGNADSRNIERFRDRIQRVHPDAPAYVIFTSGSTGRPRGVLVTHRNLVASTSARRVTYERPPRRFLLTPSIGFDSSVVGLFWPLATGGTVVIPSDDAVRDVDRLAEIIEQHRVTHLLMVPSLYRALLTRHAGRLASLETSIVAGEACSTDVVDLHAATLGDEVEMFNEYGPTETTVWATVHPCEPGESVVPIGRPIAGVTARVANPAGVPVPLGVAGELLTAGPTVARYLDDAAANAARFVELDGRRWYRTGDLARVDQHDLRFLGRVDDQLNVGGVRLEPSEIEGALTSMPGVVDAVVVASSEPRSRLIAHVISEIGESQLRSQLADVVPSTHVPARVLAHAALPRTSHGKLDRRAAAALPIGNGHTVAESAADATLTADVVRVWRSALGRDDIGAHSDYFEIGGDSLSAVEISSALEAEFGFVVSIGDLLDGRTPAGLAERLAGRADQATGAAVNRVVTMRAGEATSPLIVMTPGWDDIFGYQALAEQLPDDVTVIAATASEVATADIDTTVDALGSSFSALLAEHDAVSRSRPITVLGWSTGGIVAYDLAIRLRDAGCSVQRVVMVDTYFPGAEQRLWSNRWWKYRSLMRHPSAFLGETRATVRRRSKAIAKSLGTRLLRFSGTVVPKTPARASAGGVPLEAFGYRPEPCEIPVLLYAASFTNPDRTYRCWRTVAEVEVVPVRGRHRGFESVMGPDRVSNITDDLAPRL